jgi:hypothetical protein
MYIFSERSPGFYTLVAQWTHGSILQMWRIHLHVWIARGVTWEQCTHAYYKFENKIKSQHCLCPSKQSLQVNETLV